MNDTYILQFYKKCAKLQKKSIYANAEPKIINEPYKKKKDCPLDNPISYLTLNLIP